jgi:hypothetical protein
MEDEAKYWNSGGRMNLALQDMTNDWGGKEAFMQLPAKCWRSTDSGYCFLAPRFSPIGWLLASAGIHKSMSRHSYGILKGEAAYVSNSHSLCEVRCLNLKDSPLFVKFLYPFLMGRSVRLSVPSHRATRIAIFPLRAINDVAFDYQRAL